MVNTELMKAGEAPIDFQRLTYTPITTLEELRAAAQLAIQVEFATIPVYLYALYSIVDTSSDAYQTLRSVVMEEMFHFNQAANLLVGIGGQPVFTNAAVPLYPAYLPSADTKAAPYVGLFRASKSVFRDVFMAIETPAPFSAPEQDKNYTTVGQLYKALWDGIQNCVKTYGKSAVFKQTATAEQRTDIYLGKFGGKLVDVVDEASAKLAIDQIVEQGEGAVDPTHPLVPYQPYGSYHHYGNRTDGTYGPILGTPFELSHFYKFMNVANAETFPQTYPIVSNPKISEFVNQKAVDTAKAFNKAYGVMVGQLEQAFTKAGGKSGVYFNLALPLMHNVLPPLAKLLMQTPMQADGDNRVGPNVGPTFEYVKSANFASLLLSLNAVHDETAKPASRKNLADSAGQSFVFADSRASLRDIISQVTELKRLSDNSGMGLSLADNYPSSTTARS